MPDVAGALADFLVRTRHEDLPEACVQKATHCFLDLIGVTLAGSNQQIAKAVTEHVKARQCAPACTIIGRRLKTSPTGAAFVNGTAGHVLEYDDIKTKIGHPSVAIIPAVLALAESLDAGGQETLTAFVLGFEIACKIAAGVEPALSMNGWHTTSAVGIFGAAAAAAKLLSLNAGQVRNALGIAASFAGGLVRNFGTSIKPVHAGQAAENGLKAALLAGKGINADPDVLSGKWGFPQIFAGEYDEGQITANLGEPFEVLANGFKFYPCCASAHTAIDAVLALLKEIPIQAADVEKVEVGTVPVNVDNLKFTSPQNPTEAKFSMQFCLASALLQNQVILQSFTDERLNDPLMQALMPRISMYLHPDLAHLGYVGTENSIVTIHMRNGQRHEKRVDIPRGHHLNPLSQEELGWKYSQCAKGSISHEAVEKTADMILNLASLGSVPRLMNMLTPIG